MDELISEKNFVHQVKQMFKPGGALQNALPGFEARDPQIQMAELVAKCLENNLPGIAQAGVGTGKTFGYLLPACLYAVTEGKRIVISTNTKDLQRQIINHDLPLVQRILARLDYDLCFGEAKGQSNYICMNKFNELVNQDSEDDVIQKMKAQIEDQPSMVGDRSSFDFDIPFDTWKQVEGCLPECKDDKDSNCFSTRSQQRLQVSNIIVTNHAKFFADLYSKSRGYGQLPDYDCVIFDEAHRIEDVYVQFWKQEISLEMLEKVFRPLLVRSAKWMKSALQGNVLSTLLDLRNQILNKADHLFKSLHRNMVAGELHTIILEQPVVKRNPFEELFIELYSFIKLQTKPYMDYSDAEKKGFHSLARRYEDLFNKLEWMLTMGESEEWAYWIEIKEDSNPARQVYFHAAPYDAFTALKTLYQEGINTIFTSGTIAPGGDFTIPARMFGIKNYLSLDVKSPFNYNANALLVYPDPGTVKKQIPEEQSGDSAAAYYDQLTLQLKEILMITKGSTFVLFTSMESIRQTESRMAQWIIEQNMDLFVQTVGANRDKLLEGFIHAKSGVLFGAESFWEGINVPGDDLRCVVIPRIPFPNPSDPFNKAKAMRMEKEGLNSFFKRSLPVALIKMNQGFGRLVRTSTDRGAVIILDERLVTKKYGDTILRALPNARRTRRIADIQRYFKEEG